jgi:hypothetical protein
MWIDSRDVLIRAMKSKNAGWKSFEILRTGRRYRDAIFYTLIITHRFLGEGFAGVRERPAI